MQEKTTGTLVIAPYDCFDLGVRTGLARIVSQNGDKSVVRFVHKNDPAGLCTVYTRELETFTACELTVI